MAEPISGAALVGASALSSILSGVFGAGTSAAAAKKNYKYQKALMAYQYNLTRSLNQNAYQDTTYSMREAGINPMLAINQGVNGLSAGAGGNPSQQGAHADFDLLNAISTAKQLKNDTQRVKNETDLNNSTIRKQDYESDLAHEQSAFINEQNRQLQKFGELERQQNLINSAKQGALLDAQKADVENQIYNRNKSTISTINLNSAAANAHNASAHSHPWKDISTAAHNFIKANSGKSFKQMYDDNINYLIDKSR